MAEFLPGSLLEFLNAEGLIMMLHTSGMGVGDRDVQQWLRAAVRRYPRVRIVLAHLGRYVRPQQFLDFLDARVLDDCPSLYLEMSSATCTELYQRVLERKELWSRLLFGSDLPFGLITGVERWSEARGAIFLTRDTYTWSDPKMNADFAAERRRLTYNTYHVIKAFKDALAAAAIDRPTAQQIRDKVFRQNAVDLFAGSPCGSAGAASLAASVRS
jgi:predicted TIM-barrel fold metal-dependent hydrolase